MIFCEYCGHPTELISKKEFKYSEIFDLPVVIEEHYKCTHCFHKFYIPFDKNKYKEHRGEQHTG